MRFVRGTLAVLAMAGVAIAVTAIAAAADTVATARAVSGVAYRGGNPAAGAVGYATAVVVDRDPAGEVVAVRATATVSKRSKAATVQVTGISLATAKATVLAGKAVNSGTAAAASSATGWRAVAPRTCTAYRARATFSVHWVGGAVTNLPPVLTALTNVCGPTRAPAYANCAQLNKVFPHGVGRPGARDHTAGKPVTTYYASAWIYNANTGRDADHDGIACEKR